jgi:hypothetical protein
LRQSSTGAEERWAICPVLWKATHPLDAVPNQPGEMAMNRFNTVVVAGALLAVPMSSAAAGPCTAEIENVTKMMAARDAGTGPTTGAGGAAAQQPADRPAQHPPTEIIGRETQGKAASPQDVQSQTRGGPTAAEQAQGARRPAAEAMASAQAALEEARNHDRAGNEGQCMDAIGRAKRSLG